MKRERIKTDRTAGFTLFEILLAMLVLSIGVLSVTGLIDTSLQNYTKSRDDLDAANFADMVMGYYQSMDDWDEIPSLNEELLVIDDYFGNPIELATDEIAQYSYPSATNNNARPLTYLIKPDEVGYTKSISLTVWSGYSTNGQPSRFYTEFFNWRGDKYEAP